MAVNSHTSNCYSLSIPLVLFLITSFSSLSNAESFVDQFSHSSLPRLLTANFSNHRILQVYNDQQQIQLEYDFYRNSCPNAETIVYKVMHDVLDDDKKITARLLRLMFHDCFIQGCDASVLLDDSNGNPSHLNERDAVPNQTLKGLEVIDIIKEELEIECPNIVSCSDIIALATRNAIILSGGPFFPVLTGRRDSRVSYHDEANSQIPRPHSNIHETLFLFSQRGFNEKEVVSLLGAHNIGKIGCEFILDRISNFHDTGRPDPTIPRDFMLEINKICNADVSPSPSQSRLRNLIESTTGLSYFQSLAPFIFSGSGFDTHYYKSLLLGRGLLFADQQLMSDPRTARLVEVFASDDGSIFRREFSKAMLKMSTLQSPAASQGVVRTRCSLPNSS
ncbi:peroxidase 28-like [Silene latifolia]|uniref:peroxidase 28-like n=1 Tax=Silene latifolia TaxID=37657 RepID=UPI003D786D1B